MLSDAARIERRLHLVDHREGRDRGQARRLCLAGEELADAAVGDAHHPHLVVSDPGLTGDRLDDVVAVEVLQRLEEVERAPGAAGAAHVDVDDREPHDVGESGDPALRALRPRVAVAGVLDQGRGRHAVAGRVGRQVDAPDVRHVRRRMDRVGKLGAVAGGHVAVPVGGDALVVDVRRGRRRLRRQHRQRLGRLAGGVEADAVAVPRFDVAEQRPTPLVGAPGLDHAAAGVEQ